jgi:hypothetical protein
MVWCEPLADGDIDGEVRCAVISRLFLQREASRNAGVAQLAALFRIIQAIQPGDLSAAANLACGRVFPAHFNKEAMVGESALLRAIALTTGMFQHQAC